MAQDCEGERIVFLRLWLQARHAQLHYHSSQVFVIQQSRKQLYYVVAYGASLVIVVVSVCVYSEGYGGQALCWLSPKRGLMFAFVGPVSFVLLVNVVMFFVTMRELHAVDVKNAKFKRQQSNLNSNRLR